MSPFVAGVVGVAVSNVQGDCPAWFAPSFSKPSVMAFAKLSFTSQTHLPKKQRGLPDRRERSITPVRP